ncbi:Transforming growth factor-beta, N-terminal domain and Transforming growth factor-beta, C-terminal domain-containing protein [Strongyloides ratti]|uniref:Transforming growth factor-beta, N-terminal domain and Transforming growth factor-beta, C-terminal domain-containing protein n=1 Tax=Strongyloides ratti TaxID=34506 RepID=A0A090LN19_STRRB|nr:Transforming growth factor-beta, N-terminal domain and Transforming growth factor-beta, C-terminal domain-containing protein [Strongyloides ratti]CEF71136.1 Transforming growth factor-beta, N-terminal domain and Transforming growth factor-beta, C-terminal domain-containing protein [Strongyloides ratti]
MLLANIQQLWINILIFWIILPGYTTSSIYNNFEGKDLENKKHLNEGMKETVKEMLNYNKYPHNSSQKYSRKVTSPAGKYMLALFDKYTKSAIANLSYSDSNIIRSFNPIPYLRDIRYKDSLVFNISVIDSSEEILRGDLYIYQKHLPKNLFNYQIPDVVSIDSDGFELNFKGKKLEHNLFFWNVTISLKNARIEKNNFLIFVFKKNSKYVPLRNIIQSNSPFLLVYSESDASRREAIDRRLKKMAYEDSEENIDNHLINGREKFNRGRHFMGRQKRQVDYMTYNTQNRVNNEDSVKKYVNKFVVKGPKILNGNRKKNRKGKKQKNNYDLQDPMMGFGEYIDDNTKEDNDIDIFNNNNDDNSNKPAGLKLLDGRYFDTQKCGKRTLQVKFSDIGWGSKVIAPKVFEANYCSGTCSFPLTKDVHHSNHAIIQSLLYNMKIIPSIPNVCCAPESMDSLTILYFDEQDNVVLKTYPKMSVSSCSCI